jgi:hypothetical protein
MGEYNIKAAFALELFVRKTFWECLSNDARRLYMALPSFERTKSRFCGLIVATYRELADASGLNKDAIKVVLLELVRYGLVKFKVGEKRVAGKRAVATEITRCGMAEIKAKSIEGDGMAQRLALALNERPFKFKGEIICPTWSLKLTGKLNSSNPNFQRVPGHPRDLRFEGLKSAAVDGLGLVHRDIKAAEPTILKHLAGIPLELDAYQIFAEAVGCSRDDAKPYINSLSNCRDTMWRFGQWPSKARSVLKDYAGAVHEFKLRLVEEFEQNGRLVRTMGGRPIHALPRTRPHPGKLLARVLQGTVADVINSSCWELLDIATVIAPVHDCVYAVLPADQTELVAGVIIEQARRFGLTIEVKEAGTYSPGSVHPDRRSPPSKNMAERPSRQTQSPPAVRRALSLVPFVAVGGGVSPLGGGPLGDGGGPGLVGGVAVGRSLRELSLCSGAVGSWWN